MPHLLAGPLLHPGLPPQPHDLWQSWSPTVGVLFSLTCLAVLYWRGQRRRQARPAAWRAAAFWAGWAALLVALLSPLDALATALFSAHMGQHMLLVLVAAPLLALSAPIGVMLLGLPGPVRLWLGRTWRRSPLLRATWSAFSHPALAWGLHAATLWVWHLPAAYQAALTQEWLHGLEHVSFFGTSALFWWAALHPAPRQRWLHGPGGALYIFTLALQGGLLGALITFAAQPWYPVYAATTLAWGLSPLEDQQLAGALMWIPAGLVYLGGALLVLGRWYAEMERRDALLLSAVPHPAETRVKGERRHASV